MDNLKMILFDGTELNLEGFGLPMHAVMTCQSNDELLEKWKLFTPMNLSRVEVQLSDEAVFTFAGGVLEGVQSVINLNGTITAHFYMKGERLETVTDTTAEYVTAAKILLGEEE